MSVAGLANSQAVVPGVPVMADPVGSALHLVQSGFTFVQTLAPGGFGVLLIPLSVLGFLSYLATRKG